MGRAAKIAGGIVGGVVLIVAGTVGYVEATANFDHPDTPKPALKASDDPEVIARGEYLVNAVGHCSACHQDGDKLDKNAGNTVHFSSSLSGGMVFEAGPFGTFYAQNITPHPTTGIGRYSDEELARVLKHSVARDGKIAAFMRLATGPMSDEDIVATMSYLRAQEPVEKSVPPDEFGFMARAISNGITPRTSPAPPYAPPGEVSEARGRYLAEGPGVCWGCHTPLDPMAGFAKAGDDFSGAEPEPDPTSESHMITAPNITSGGRLASLDEEGFVTRFRSGRADAMKGSKMPWENFQRMTDNDLRSIFRYLKSVPPSDRDPGPSRFEN